MDKIILVFSIIVACAIGIGTGVSLGAIQTGEMSSQINQAIDGFSNSFSSSAPISNVTSSVQSAINSAKIAFGFDVVNVDEDEIPNSQDEFLLNAISSCAFHSDQNIPSKTCVVCTLLDEAKEPLASGNVTLPNYASSSNISIPITDLEFEGANDLLIVKSLEVKVCELSNTFPQAESP